MLDAWRKWDIRSTTIYLQTKTTAFGRATLKTSAVAAFR